MALRWLAAIGLILLVGVLAGCGGDDEDNGTPAAGENGELTTVTVGQIPYSGMSPLHLGIEQGFFEDQGLKLDLTPGEAPAAILSQVLSGRLDIGFTTTITLITAVSEGASVKAIAPVEGLVAPPEGSATAIMVPADSSIQSAADLEGKKVAVPALQSELDLLTKVVVDEDGGDSSQVQSVQIEFPEMLPALKAGRVDAIATSEPFLSLALEDGAEVLVDPELEVVPNGSVTAWAASEQFIAENPDVVEGFATAMRESLEYAADHPEEARDIIGTFTEIEPDVLQEMKLGVVYDPELNLDSVDKTIDLMTQYGFIEDPPTLEDVVHEGG